MTLNNDIDNMFNDIRLIYDKINVLNKSKMEEALSGYSASEVHCIEFIGKSKEVNVKKLSEHFFMTRGAMSKITKKLIDKQAITSYQKDDNKKEIFYLLTQEGQRIFDTHESLHQTFRMRDQDILDELTDETIKEINYFLRRYNDHLSNEIDKESLKKS